MPRCPDCNKFVSYGDPDVDEVEIQLDDTVLSMSGQLNLTCEQ